MNDKLAQSESAKRENSGSDSTKIVDSLALKEKSLGVRKVEILTAQYGLTGKIAVFFMIFLVAYAYGLDGMIRGVYQVLATNSYAQHSLVATVNVIRGVVAAAAQPTYARLSDVFGRAELIIVAALFYLVGTVIESQAYDVQRFAAGAIFYQIGYTGIMLILQIVIADFSFLNWRLVCSFVPALPFIINTWISGDVTAAMDGDWSWGIGMWAIIFPVVCIPLILSFYHMSFLAKKRGDLDEISNEISDFKRMGLRKFLVHLFWQLDVIGVFLLMAVLALILIPFTLAGGVDEQWRTAKVIAPICVGGLLIPFFVWCEAKSPHPIAPVELLRNRGVWAAILIGIFINFIWYMQGDYLYTVLIVSVNESVKSATRITSLYSFVSVLTGTFLGFLVVRVRRLKPFILFGVSMWFVAMGLLVYYRGNSGARSGIIGAQCLLGFGAGFFTYPTQAAVQACVDHEHMAVITSIYLASYNIGSAFGGSISGAIWTNLLPRELSKYLNNPELELLAYGSPFDFIVQYPWGTPERMAVVAAYRYTQKCLCITGLCLCVPLLVWALFLRDYELPSSQSMEKGDFETREVAFKDIFRFSVSWKEVFTPHPIGATWSEYFQSIRKPTTV
ncbi:hypothetical protein CANCADRAFT_30763 [Tortispora caseinolytica NRRL Y-17796]|uniref:Major facilitator superfamily (MFS) profile domain-containing protein n=1 Tax=Tortispora caseinolytica NRRL Y-17796 TaxID=767744 RepID=A0A1E4TLQ4_9ASCO|nr:hypothetical protein CANCADRAFT_30763 [Tortispora caseinolytica NRRL Y-17796]